MQRFARPDEDRLDTSPWLRLLPELAKRATSPDPSSPPVFLFTTNYDTGLAWLWHRLIEKGVRLTSGFEREPKESIWRRDYLRSVVNWGGSHDGASNVVHLQLHGCVSWIRDTPGDPVAEYYDEQGNPLSDPKRVAVIWPAIRKRPFDDPFWTHHQYLVRMLERAERVLFIGYGFRDETIRALIGIALTSRDLVPPIIVADRSQESWDEATGGHWAPLPFQREAKVECCDFEAADALDRILAALYPGTAGPAAPEHAPALRPPPSQWTGDDCKPLVQQLQDEVQRQLAQGAATDLRVWEQQGGSWQCTPHSAVSPGAGGDWKALRSPQSFVSFALEAEVTCLTGGHYWYGIALFHKSASDFLLLQVQGRDLKLKWVAGADRMQVVRGLNWIAPGRPLTCYLAFDGKDLRIGAVQGNECAYYSTDELAGLSGHLALMVRDGPTKAKFENVRIAADWLTE